MGRSVFVGALLAVAVVAGLLLGGYLHGLSSGVVPSGSVPSRVVLIFESPAEDGATVAALIAVVSDGKMLDVSPDTTVTIPGTSSSRLGDAFVFGGGAAVAREVGAGGRGGSTAFVSVPESVWRSALEATRGVVLDVPQKLAVFDGAELTTIHSGQQTLNASETAAMLRGIGYLEMTERKMLRQELELQLGAATAAARPAANRIESDLSPTALASWLQSSLARAAIRQSD